MVEKEKFQGSKSYKCEKCSLHYETEELAGKCENFCKDKEICKSDIAMKSLERD